MKSFFDTNVIVYAQTAGPKAELCRNLMNEGGVISIQVLNEFANVLSRKLMISWEEVGERISDVLVVMPDPLALTLEDHERARSIALRYRLSFYDSLIVATAGRAGCAQVLSEDLPHGQLIDGIKIVNPFNF